MGVLGDALEFLTTAANWSGPAGIPVRFWQHVSLCVLAVLMATAAASPLGMYIGHTGRFRFFAISIGNLGRALPSLAILGFFFPLTLEYNLPGDIGFSATLIAMVVLGIPPILLNSYVGIESVDADLVESARGMGMTERQILAGTELPLGISLILAGVRNSAVAIVATASLGAVFGWGGLGRFIVDGFATGDHGQIVTGAVLVAALAIATEISLGLVERRLRVTEGVHEPETILTLPPAGVVTS